MRSPPEMLCGDRGATSSRIRVVWFEGGSEAKARDFRGDYTPADGTASGAIR